MRVRENPIWVCALTVATLIQFSWDIFMVSGYFTQIPYADISDANVAKIIIFYVFFCLMNAMLFIYLSTLS